MKILGIHGIGFKPSKDQSGIDIWRIQRPLRELALHTDWQIDYQPTLIRQIEKYKDQKEFSEVELENAAKFLGRYDIVYSSYFFNRTSYTLLKVVRDRYGTQFVLDIDDDMFAINAGNPIWAQVTEENVDWVKRMIVDNDWLTTTTPQLKAFLSQERRDKLPSSIGVLPNFIADDYKAYAPANYPNVVVGYFGGVAHWDDLHETGFPKAMRDLMKTYPNVIFKTVGVPLDSRLPKARHIFVDGMPGTDWIDTLYPKLQMDIVVAPLEMNRFNIAKSDIKWQEVTRMGAAFVASNVGPYSKLQHGVNALLTNNTRRDWYDKLAYLIEDAEARAALVEHAQADLLERRLETNWQVHRDFFEHVKANAVLKVADPTQT